jgi:hypothetical protein
MRLRSWRWATATLCLPIALWLAGCHLQPRLAVAPLPAWDAAFDRASGWVGGDGASSTPLGGGRTLWLFGDTFVGRVEGGRRVQAQLIANSLAVQPGGQPGPGSLEFFYRNDAAGLPLAAFAPPDGGAWFWPLHAVRTPAGLFLFLLQVERTDPASVFGFRVHSTMLARIAEPDAPPAAWRPELRPIPGTDGRRLVGTSVLTVGGVCYVYGTVEDAPGRRRAIVARVASERIWDFAQWRFFAGQGWEPDSGRAAPVCDGVAAELSVSWQPGIGRYVMVHSAAWPSPEMVVRYAAAPEGPWSAPEVFFSCPEAAWDPRVFCYAAKGHPEVDPSPGGLTVTYVANATELALVESDARLYRPRFLRITFLDGSLF